MGVVDYMVMFTTLITASKLWRGDDVNIYIESRLIDNNELQWHLFICLRYENNVKNIWH